MHSDNTISLSENESFLRMEAQRVSDGRGRSPCGEERAIATAGAIFSFLLAIKLALLAWNIFVQHNHPLADAPADGPLFLCGGDLLVCIGVAMLVLLTYRLDAAAHGKKFARVIGRVLRTFLYV